MSSHADTIRRMAGQRLTEQQRAWLLKMPAWTAVRGEDILRHLDGLVVELADERAESQRLREALEAIRDSTYDGRLEAEQFAREALAGDAA